MYTINLLVVFATLWHVIRTSARNAYVEEYHTNRRFTCSEKHTRNATSEIQCVHHCLRKGKCSIANYKESNNAKSMTDNCEVFDVPSSHKSCSTVYSVGWKGLVLMVRKFRRLCIAGVGNLQPAGPQSGLWDSIWPSSISSSIPC